MFKTLEKILVQATILNWSTKYSETKYFSQPMHSFSFGGCFYESTLLPPPKSFNPEENSLP